MTVVAVTGHRHLRDPASVRTALEQVLAGLSPPVTGISTLAAGADQLFAEAVLTLGGRLEVIVPSRDYAQSLAPDVRPHFDRLCAAAAEVFQLPEPQAGRDAYVAAAEAMLERSDVLVAVWDGNPGRGAGGTADVVRMARERGIAVAVVPSERPVGA